MLTTVFLEIAVAILRNYHMLSALFLLEALLVGDQIPLYNNSSDPKALSGIWVWDKLIYLAQVRKAIP